MATKIIVFMPVLFITLSITIGVLTVYLTSLKPSKTCQFRFERIGKSSIITSSQPRSVAVGDFNNDNRLDIVVANSGIDAIGIFFSFKNGTFANQKIYSTGFQSRPYLVIVQDFNNDQKLDIAVANYGTHTIGIFLGYGNETFADQMRLSTGSAHPLFIIGGDFNNDNRSDIAVAYYGTNDMNIFLGNGDGFFQLQATYFTGYDSLPNSLAVGDFNSDSYLDIVIANYGTNNIAILLGYGNGSFASPKTFTTGPSSYPSSVALGDFNKDNYLDIAVANYGNKSIGIHLGHGNGTFKSQTLYSTGTVSRPSYITVGHLNKDNELDIIIADTENDRIYIMPGNANGTFVTLATYDMISGSSPLSIVVADFDRDNQSDIIAANFGTSNVLTLSGYTSAPSVRQTNYLVSSDARPTAVVINDFTGDNHLDIVVNDYTNSRLLLLTGYGNGTFARKGTYSTGNGSTPQYISIGDFNNDNRMDIVTANIGSDSVGVLLGQDDIYFGAVTTYFIGIGAQPWCVAVGDIDNDKQLDIVSANSGTGSISILLGHGDGTFVIIGTYPIDNYIISYSVTVGDVNNDHRLDIIATAFGTNIVVVLLGYGNGSFEQVRAYSTANNSMPFSLALADLNGDSYLDIIVTNYNGDSLSILLGIGDGSFETQTTYFTGSNSQPYSVIIADFSGDNISDIAATLYGTDAVVVFFGYGNGSFYLARTYSTGLGSAPYGITFADFDKDKQLEIVVTLWNSGNIAILTEYYAAQFESPMIYSTGSAPYPYSVATGDYNNDHRSDLVVANSGTDSVNILFGLGDGTFEKPMMYLTGINSHPQYVATTDINQDSQLDIVVANSGTDTLSMIMGYGNGSFGPSIIYSTGNGSHPSTVIFGDLRNDNQSDIVVVNEYTNNVGIFFKFDYATFESQKTYSSEGNEEPWAIVVNDFNNDSYLDIAFTYYGTGNVGILLGYGNGSFDVMITFSTGINSNPVAMAVADFNKDNRLDIAVVNQALNNVAIFFGYGNGTFGSMLNFSTGDDSLPYAVTLGDFNNDGHLDMAVANYKSNNVGVLLGCGNGSFGIVVTYSTGYNSLPIAVVNTDFNNNGQLDIAVANFYNDTVGILLGYGNGTFGNQVTYPLGFGFQPTSVAVGYLNSDNYIDIAISDFNGNDIGILLGYGNGTFADVTKYSTGGSRPLYVTIGDLNNDHRLDIVVANFGSDNIVVLYGLGDGTFLLGRTYSTDVGSGPTALALGDFNNDNRLDITVTNQNLYYISVFLRNGSESFANIITFATGDGSQPYSAAVGDFNNDGRADIVVANHGSGNVGIFLGHGNANFNTMISYPTGPIDSAPYSVAIGDFNDDNQSDLVVTNSATDNVAILLGFSNGTFALPVLYSTGDGSSPYTVSVADFNNDNIMDIVVANSGTNNIFFLYGYGNGTFGNEELYPLGYDYRPYSIAVSDLNQDGWMDIVIACYNTDSVEILMKMCT